jgi:hypothetical protein
MSAATKSITVRQGDWSLTYAGDGRLADIKHRGEPVEAEQVREWDGVKGVPTDDPPTKAQLREVLRTWLREHADELADYRMSVGH